MTRLASAVPGIPPSAGRRLSETPFLMWLTAIALGALVLRVAYVVVLRHHFLSGDGLYYHYAAIDLRNGHGFVNPLDPSLPASAHHPPAWTLFLAVPPLLGFSSLFAHQLFAALVGVATVVVVGLAGRRISSDRGGLIAATLAAAYPGLWVYEQELLSETLLFLAVATIVIAAYRFHAEPTRRRAMTLGGLCGVLALVRSEQILLVVALLVPLVLSRVSGNRRRLEYLALSGVATLLVIAPWTVYNLGRLDKPVFLSTSFGAALAQGNCDPVYSGRLLGYYDFACLGTTAQSAARRGSKHPFDDAVLRGEAVHYMSDHVGRLPVVSLARQGRAWSFFHPLQTADLEAQFAKGLGWVHRAALFFYWALILAAVVGGVELRRRRVPLHPLVAPFVVTIAIAATTYGQPRLRAGAEVPLVLLAAVGIEHLLTRKRSTTPPTASPEVMTRAEPEAVLLPPK